MTDRDRKLFDGDKPMMIEFESVQFSHQHELVNFWKDTLKQYSAAWYMLHPAEVYRAGDCEQHIMYFPS